MENETSNGMATAGFVLALITLFFGWLPVAGWITWLLGLIFSSIGLSRANKIGGTGKGLAIAGLVISLIGIILIILLASTILALVGLSSLSAL